jgi:hypothetical protein
MKRILILILLALPAMAAKFHTSGPSTTNNDDSCDVATLPAATLLLPFFEVDTESPASGKTTLFTVTNVTSVDQIALVTIWTDYGYPVLSFNIYLTGYDVQAINLFDVIARGIIAPDAGTGTDITDRGDYSDPNTTIDLAQCDRLPGAIDDAYIDRLQDALMLGKVDRLGPIAPCGSVGGQHEFATGYVTIDVAGKCTFLVPSEPEYFSEVIRYDNVLTGDYQQIDSAQNYAQVHPLVHIRAIPEGGTPTSRQTGLENRVNFERTFYANYAPETHNDGRQPLPSTFAARWIQGSPLQFETFYKIWREVNTGAGSVCGDYAANADLPVPEVVVFDENENFAAMADPFTLPATSMLAIANDAMPQMTNGAVSGWTYFNLESAQNWIVVSMRSQGRYSVDFDAVALGNGCSAPRGVSEASQEDGAVIGPAPNETP